MTWLRRAYTHSGEQHKVIAMLERRQIKATVMNDWQALFARQRGQHKAKCRLLEVLDELEKDRNGPLICCSN